MCTELLVENQDLFPRRLYCRDDQTVVRGPLVALGPNLGGPRDLVEKMLISRKRSLDMPRFASFACHVFKFSGEDPRPLLRLRTLKYVSLCSAFYEHLGQLFFL